MISLLFFIGAFSTICECTFIEAWTGTFIEAWTDWFQPPIFDVPEPLDLKPQEPFYDDATVDSDRLSNDNMKKSKSDRRSNDNVKKSKCTWDADCTATGYKCDLTWEKNVKGTGYGMCRDTTCTNNKGDEYCNEIYGRYSFCDFDNARQAKGNDYDIASELNSECEKTCDPHCYGSTLLVLEHGGRTGGGNPGEFCSHHHECFGPLLCDYTMNTVTIGGYSMGVCRYIECTDGMFEGSAGQVEMHDCTEVQADPSKCGHNNNWLWQACRATCDPNCYGAPINEALRSALDENGMSGVDTSLVGMYTERPMSASVFVKAFAVFGFTVTVYGAGKHYMTK